MILWRSKLDLNDVLLDEVIGKVKDSSTRLSGEGMYTTYHIPDINEREEVIFAEKYKEIIGEGLSTFGLHHRCSYYFDHWVQIYSDGNQGHSQHDHYGYNTLVSWVHFVRPTDTKHFYFLDSDGNKTYPEQNAGDFIMFSPWHLHAVDPSNELRVVISGNVYMKNLVSPDTKETSVYHQYDRANYSCQEISTPKFLL